MVWHVRSITVFLACLFFSFNLMAFGWHPHSNKGILITPDHVDDDKVSFKSGETAIKSGKICAVTWGHLFLTKEQCRRLLSKLEVKAYFPDATTDVTSDLVLTKSSNKKELIYSYTTPVLKSGEQNILRIVVGPVKSKVDKLLKIQAKFNKRIAFIEKRMEFHKDRKSHKNWLIALERLRDKLKLYSQNITKLIEKNPDVLAQINIPIQVDNDYAEPFYYSSMFGGQKLSMEIPLGLPIDGESTKLKVAHTNLGHLSFWFPEVDTPGGLFSTDEESLHQYVLKAKFKNNEIFRSDSTSLPFGESIEKELPLDSLQAFDSNEFLIETFRETKSKFFKDKTYMRRVGLLKYSLNVAQDLVQPIFRIDSPKKEVISYYKNLPELKGTIKDEFGRVDFSSFSLNTEAKLIDGSNENLDKTSLLQLEKVREGQEYKLQANLNTLPEGLYKLSLSAKDFAENNSIPFPEVRDFRIDRTLPEVALNTSDNQITNNPSFDLPIVITDHSPVSVKIIHNGQLIHETAEVDFSFTSTLVEGINKFEVHVVDAAGNIAEITKLDNIELDTIPPILSEVVPTEGDTLSSLYVDVKGKLDRPVSKISVNGIPGSFNSRLGFDIPIEALAEGAFKIDIYAKDLAGNETNLTINTQIVLKVLNADLIKIESLSEDNSRLRVSGIRGASRPNININFDAGFLNSTSVTSNSDGSFSTELDFFRNVNIRAHDPTLNKSESIFLDFYVDTTLSGVVRDLDDKPLPGVIVEIQGTNQKATTDASGVFSIANPATGDHRIIFDGRFIDESITGTNKKYFAQALYTTIGSKTKNIINRVIYMTHLLKDGSETVIPDENTAVTVSSVDVPGVEIEIPAGYTKFPDGQNTGAINVLKVPQDKLLNPTPDFAVPEHVYSFEPSGVTFKKRVKLTLPNENEFAPKAEIILLSKNSKTGGWEIGGLANVSDDGQSIVTKEDMGILHFSEIYAVPRAPMIEEYGDSSKIGADVSSGSVSTSVTLPSYKALGQSIAPMMYYKSNWANPNAVISNIIDIPRDELKFTYGDTEKHTLYKIDRIVKETSWSVPERITAQFQVSNLRLSEKQPFTGVPNKSIISYQASLDQMPSGVFPYLAKYEIQLKRMILRSITVLVDSKLGKDESHHFTQEDSSLIPQLFPNDIAGSVIVQNKRNSEAGRGWKIGGVSKILNPAQDRIVLEKGDGTPEIYTINNTIDTVYFSPSGNLRSFALDNDNLVVIDEKNRVFSSSDLNNKVHLASIPDLIGRYEWSYRHHVGGSHWQCRHQTAHFSKERIAEGMIIAPNGTKYFADRSGNIMGINTSNNVFDVSGRYTSTPDGGGKYRSWFCGREGVNCYGDYYSRVTDAPGCWWPRNETQGTIQEPGYIDSTLNLSAFRAPMGMSPGVKPSTILVADSGNYRIREIDLINNRVKTIAGTGTNADLGDGGYASEASFYRPRGVTIDSSGNIYISTSGGLIRKIDTTGRISHLAGTKAGNENAVLDYSAHAKNMILSSPYGMAIDEKNSLFYIADTGNNRIVQLNLKTMMMNTVAGSGDCIGGDIGDKKAALNASLCSPTHIHLDKDGNLLVLDKGHNRIRKVIMNKSETSEVFYLSSVNPNVQLKKLADNSYELVDRNGMIEYFDKDGYQIKSRNSRGLESTYEYVDSKLSKMIDPVGGVTQYSYSANKLLSIEDPAGKVTSFDYDGDLLSKVNFPDGSSKSYIYDENGVLTEEFNQRGKSTKYLLNQWGRLVDVVRADGTKASINDSKSKTISNGNTDENPGHFNSLDNKDLGDGIVDAKGNTTTLNKDESGYVNEIIDAEGKVTLIDRDFDGRPLKIVRPDNSYVDFVYDQTTFDLTEKFDSSTGIRKAYTYNNRGQIVTELEDGVVISQNYYDSVTGEILKKENKRLNQFQEYKYNELGLISEKTYNDGSKSFFEYDEYGNIAKSTDPKGNITSYERDASGNITKISNAEGQEVFRAYDEFNRLISVTSHKSEKTEYVYTETGQLLNILDPKGKVTSFIYNDLDQLTEKTDSVGRVTKLEYDANGNVSKEIDPNGNIKIFEYNKLDKLTKKILPDDLYEFDYDSRGNVKFVRNSVNQVNFEYEHFEEGDVVSVAGTFGRGSRTDLPSLDIEYSYNKYGQRISLIDGDEVNQYEYDAGLRLSKITNHIGEVYTFDYDAKNRIDLITRPGSSTSYTFYENDILKSIEHLKGATKITDYNYTINGIGNITQKRTPAGSFDYTYDGKNQLTGVTNPETLDDEAYSYDSLGNRVTDRNGSYSYDQTGQKLQEDWKNLYYYDNNGNLTSKMEKDSGINHSYIYNSENRLIEYKKHNKDDVLETHATYVYDALGRRIEKVVNDLKNGKSKTRRYAYDGEDILLVFDENNERLAKYTHSSLRVDDVLAIDVSQKGEDLGVAKTKGSYQFLKDHLGSVVDVVDNSGDLVQHYSYSSFGVIQKVSDKNGLDISGDLNLEHHFSYTGREFDSESGLYHYRARAYDAKSGRFVQVDPHPGATLNPLTKINKYIYTLNNPVNRIDPRGEISFKTIAAIGIAVAAAYFTGGLAGGFAGALFNSAIVGGVVGATVGAYVGGSIADLSANLLGGDRETARLWGTILGGIAGGVAGASWTQTSAGRSPASVNEAANEQKDIIERVQDAWDAVSSHLDQSTCNIFTGAAFDPRCGTWTENINTFIFDPAINMLKLGTP